jgi:hypothetical protein
MYPRLMVRAVSTLAAEVLTFSIHYFSLTYFLLLSRTDGRVQRRLTFASDYQVGTYEYREKLKSRRTFATGFPIIYVSSFAGE